MTSKARVSGVKLGFCGLGAMGGGMACNLARRGYDITGFDVYPPSVDKLVEAGGKAATSAAQAARDVDFLILMVVNAAQVSAILVEESGGAAKHMRAGSTIIVCSTCPPSYLADLRKALDTSVGRPDLRLLDCPVSGGSIRAGNGTLSIFASGREEDIKAASQILDAMSEPLYRIPGGIGFGSIAKLCHQHQAAVNIITSSEAMALAAAAGLNTRNVYERVIQSVGRSWFLENRGPHMLDDDFVTVHSAVSIILKDCIIVTEHAARSGYPLVLENAAQQLYITGTHAGLTKEDDAGLVRIFLSPSRKSAVAELGREDSGAAVGKAQITSETVADLMAGIHLASTIECLEFAQHVEMDVGLLCDIVSRGAGQSAMFDTAASAFVKQDPEGFAHSALFKDVTARLAAALDKASEIRQPCPMAATALQALFRRISQENI